ncbi:hypothetical protein PPACK8108_LOCUS8661, partial [Phakopsora pachyrhizi]
PWFVQDKNLIPSTDQPSSTIGGSPTATPLLLLLSPPPSNVSDNLRSLYQNLIRSPFFDKYSITFIDAKLNKGHKALTNWVILVNLSQDQENSIRGATESTHYLISSLGLIDEPIRVEGNNQLASSPAAAWSFID